MKRLQVAAVAVLGLVAAGPGCNTHHTVEVESKPIDINLNIKGDFTITINDARKDVEQITGEKPKRTVSLEDIGLPPADKSSSNAGPMALPAQEGRAVVMLASYGTPAPRLAASEEDLKKSLKARAPEVRTLWNAGLVGESHTGYLVARGTLTPQQQQLLAADNADRTALYQLRAAQQQSTVEKVALAFYVVRLEYAQKGNWYEKFNKATNQWEWQQWPS